MKVVIRADSSVTIGSGHIMRCLTLAECLREYGVTVAFICTALAGNVTELAVKKGFQVHWLSTKADADWETDAQATIAVLAKMDIPVDWLVVDHYKLDARWEKVVQSYTRRIMVIDDLANRQHECELLLDANYFHKPDIRYDGLVPTSAKLLFGPQYALLRSEFFRMGTLRQRGGTVKRMLVFYGGSDPTNETGKLLTALSVLPDRKFAVDVVVGMANPYKEEIKRQCLLLNNVRFFCQVDNMAEMMTQADLAFGAGGTALWERCCLGLPSIVTAVAENQVETAQALAAAGAIEYLGFHTSVDIAAINAVIGKLTTDPNTLLALSHTAKSIVPRNGTEIVAHHMFSPHNVLVTSASAKASLLQAVKKAISKLNCDSKLIAADSNAMSLASYFCNDFWHMPPLADLAEDDLLSELAKRGVRYVIPTRDGELPFWSGKKEWLKQNGVDVMVSGIQAVDICLDKLAFYQKSLELNIPAIPTVCSLDELDAKYYVVKDRQGAGARCIGLNLTREQAVQHAKGLGQPVFQPFIEGKEYSVDAYVDSQSQVKGVVCRTRDVIINGESKVTTTVSNPELESLCTAYIQKLGLYGHVMLQLLVDHQGKVWVIECNARFGGASTLSLAAGLDSFYWFFLEAEGYSLTDYPFRKGKQILRQVRYPADLIEEVTE